MSEEPLLRLSVREFSGMLGLPESDISPPSKRLIEEAGLEYRVLEGNDRERAVRDARQQIESGQLKTAGSHRRDDWESGWAENLGEFAATGSADVLIPRYFRPAQTLRLFRRYVRPAAPDFLPRFHRLCVRILAERHLRDVAGIWEFGCGTGHNIALLADLFPGKELVGLDWAASSIKIIKVLGARYPNIRAKQFDMFRPDETLDLPENSAVLTVHALEQLGADFRPFLDYLLRKRPAVCLHIEPIIELYDANDPFDRLAIEYHRKRNYLDGFLTALRELERRGSVGIEKAVRGGIGSAYDEGYSLTVWRPL